MTAGGTGSLARCRGAAAIPDGAAIGLLSARHGDVIQ